MSHLIPGKSQAIREIVTRLEQIRGEDLPLLLR